MTGFINFAASEPLHSSASLRRETDETFFNLGLFRICKLHIPRDLCESWFESMPGSQYPLAPNCRALFVDSIPSGHPRYLKHFAST